MGVARGAMAVQMISHLAATSPPLRPKPPSGRVTAGPRHAKSCSSMHTLGFAAAQRSEPRGPSSREQLQFPPQNARAAPSPFHRALAGMCVDADVGMRHRATRAVLLPRGADPPSSPLPCDRTSVHDVLRARTPRRHLRDAAPAAPPAGCARRVLRRTRRTRAGSYIVIRMLDVER
ncbi:hypothetical protein BC628DRAFT_719382 [Trametes gibbosa]|nr:hypothetical protein BC628DRAFT_719382 [Trametes gibbosa]